MLTVGLTGGTASGKSTVVQLLREQDVHVIDCDLIAHDVGRKGAWGYKRIVSAFGTAILSADGEIDRVALGRLAFTDAAARRRLNQATHLPVAVELTRQLMCHWLRCRRLVVVDMPLLFETGSHKYASVVVLVVCSPETQLQRLMLRDHSTAAAAQARINSQMALATKLQLADVLVMNDGSTEELQQQVRQLVCDLQQHSKSWKHLVLTPVGIGAGVIGMLLLLARGLAQANGGR